jgi:hypothetical protein
VVSTEEIVRESLFCSAKSMRIAYPMSIGIFNKKPPFTGGFFIPLLISIEMSLSKSLEPISIDLLKNLPFTRGFFVFVRIFIDTCRAKESFFEKEAR